ncbi:MAG: LemA family protein [Chitinophagaceae bacterium]|nr:LemA family protein [Chitinophagaceae bacterium]
MKGTKNIGLIALAGVILIFVVWGCNGYNGIVKKDVEVTKAWDNVNAEYQNRANLVENLVETVKGAADFERQTLTDVVEARAKATSVNFSADELTPENIAKFQEAQQQMSGALSRLLVTVEQYPDLKSQPKLPEISGTTRRN